MKYHCFSLYISLWIVDNGSIDHIPRIPPDLRRITRRLGYQAQEGADAEEAFLVDVQACTARARALYQHLVQEFREHTAARLKQR
jgi:hypothetical protein